MLKRIASDALGLSDIGKIVDPSDYHKTDSDDYIRHEDGERVFFLIASESDEYCFTNLALIHLDGTSAVSSKRVMKRYPYSLYPISNVLLETAGRVDLDAEIKFTIGNTPFSIDVHKSQIEELKDLYKALLFISEEVVENEAMYKIANKSLDSAVKAITGSRSEGEMISTEFQKITEYSFEWLKDKRNQYFVKDFGYVFEKYINN